LGFRVKIIGQAESGRGKRAEMREEETEVETIRRRQVQDAVIEDVEEEVKHEVEEEVNEEVKEEAVQEEGVKEEVEEEVKTGRRGSG
jgi:hypothetical protein